MMSTFMSKHRSTIGAFLAVAILVSSCATRDTQSETTATSVAASATSTEKAGLGTTLGTQSATTATSGTSGLGNGESTSATAVGIGLIFPGIEDGCSKATELWLTDVESAVAKQDWSTLDVEDFESSSAFEELMGIASSHETLITTECDEADLGTLFPSLLEQQELYNAYPGANGYFEFAERSYEGELAAWSLCPIWPFCKGLAENN